jgi:hypothetical protein
MIPARHFIAVWLCAVALLGLTALPLADRLLLAWPGDPEATWIEAIRARKQYLAQNPPRLAEVKLHGARVLIVGGSSGLFSLDAELLERRLGRPVINLCTHAGLGLRPLLADARAMAHAGDFILLALEDAHYRNRSASLITPLAEKALWTTSPGLLRELSWPLQWTELYGHPLEDYAQGWRRRNEAMAPPSRLDAPRQYSSVELSPRGDYRGRATYAEAELRAAKIGAIKAVNREAAEDLRHFFAWCLRSGVRLAAVLPATLRPEPGQTQARSEAVLKEFLATADIPLLRLTGAEALPRELMLDTPYHTNTAGRRMVTELLARALSGPAPAPGAPCLLVASPNPVQRRELVLAEQPPATCLFLSGRNLQHPLCLTPPDLQAQVQAGHRFVFVDPEIPPLLAPAHLAARTIQTRRSTLADWFTSLRSRDLLILATSDPVSPEVAAAAPEPLRSWLSSPARCKAAIYFSLPYRHVFLHAEGETSAELRLSEADALQKTFRFPMALSLRATVQEGPALAIDHVPLAEDQPGGLRVAVLDPDWGIVLQHAAFTGPTLTEWELQEVVPAP